MVSGRGGGRGEQGVSCAPLEQHQAPHDGSEGVEGACVCVWGGAVHAWMHAHCNAHACMHPKADACMLQSTLLQTNSVHGTWHRLVVGNVSVLLSVARLVISLPAAEHNQLL
jgi:hypothetical protein